jgi:chromosome segregation protein
LRLAGLQEDARVLAAAALEAEARLAAAHHALARATADLEAEDAVLAAAQAALAALPDPCIAASDLQAAVAAEAAARGAEAEARSACRDAETALDAARASETALSRTDFEARSRVISLEATLERLTGEADLADAELAAALAQQAALPDAAELASAAALAQVAVQAADAERAAAEACHGGLSAEQARLEARLREVADDLLAWQARLHQARARVVALTARGEAARAHARLSEAAPEAMRSRAAAAAAGLADAEANHAAAAARVQAAERRVHGLTAAQLDAEQSSAACRERLARAVATAEAAEARLHAVLARAAERLGGADALPDCAEPSAEAEERARRKFERLAREREEMGPVNLRADLELEELEARIAALEREREELGMAIAKLRGSIGHLNREGRDRLTAMFTEVDQHFRTLFTRTMGGGRAHLALTGSEDPLQAGLEIYAEPPGKRLASLSLLSGGEQALTALSLIFAVFRCTPAPISVLDEVDAPLDDANVERFCTLLEDMVRLTGTRFLVVTHHQLTMSRMDRLFGVTMQERGVSRLLSVDFSRAAAMAESALQAAE